MTELLYKEITYDIRGACFWVWKEFRGAFKEKVVDRALTLELKKRGRNVDDQKRLDIQYQGVKVGTYIPDKIIDDKVLVELKCKEFLTQGDIDQFWKYLKGSKYKLGLLINFGPRNLEIKRVVYDTVRIVRDLRLEQRSGSALRSAESGQTIIETMVAVFMLTMGITAAVGLAIFALNSSSNITKQIIATGLAREGLEAVRAMRDTNWLKDTLISTCYNYQSNQNDAKCYPYWLGTNSSALFCLDPTKNQGNCNGAGTDTQNYNFGFDSTAINFWNMQPQFNNGKNYGLRFNNPTQSNDWQSTGFYAPGGGGGLTCADGAGRADYCKKIVLTIFRTSPYDKDQLTVNLVLLEVRSQVWWVDKKCPRVPDWPGSGKCSIELVTYLTNWKNY